MFQTLGAVGGEAWHRLTEPMRQPVQALLAHRCPVISLVHEPLTFICSLLTFVSQAVALVGDFLTMVGNLLPTLGCGVEFVGESFTLVGGCGPIEDLDRLRAGRFSLFGLGLTFEGQGGGAVAPAWRGRAGHRFQP